MPKISSTLQGNTNVLIALLAAALSLLLVAAGTVHSQDSGYDTEISPTWAVNPDSTGYGGFNGILSDDHLSPNGIFNFPSRYPEAYDGYGTNGDLRIPGVGSLKLGIPPDQTVGYSAWRQNGDETRPCPLADGFYTCDNLWDPSKKLHRVNDTVDTLFGREGVYRAKMNTTGIDSVFYLVDGEPQRTFDILINGEVKSPVAQFENPNRETISDTNQSTHTLSLLVRDPVGIDRVVLQVAGDEITLTNGEAVPTSDEIGDNTQRFEYEWDVGSLPADVYSVSAVAYSTDGRSNTVWGQTVTTGNTPSSIELTVAIDVDARLQQQCEETRDAAQVLIDDISDTEISRANRLSQIASEAVAYLQTKENLPDDVTSLIDDVAVLNADTAAKNELLQANSQVSCELSLAADTLAFKDVYSAHTDHTTQLFDQTISLINAYLEATDGTR